jgi:hypothetical protein
MRRRGWVMASVVVVAACSSKAAGPSSTTRTTAAAGAPTTGAAAPAGSAESPPAPADVEKVKPAPGTGNVQGKVVFDERPAVGVTVTLCEDFDQYLNGCSGQQYKAQTDSDGVFVVTDVPPKTYAALTVAVFDTNNYEYAQSDILTPQTYKVTAGQTLFADTTYLYKSDLQLVNPMAGARVSGTALTLQWQAYPDAAYYLVSIDSSGTQPDPLSDQRVSSTSYALTSPLPAGTYTWTVEAYTTKDHELAQSPDGVNFSVGGG